MLILRIQFFVWIRGNMPAMSILFVLCTRYDITGRSWSCSLRSNRNEYGISIRLRSGDAVFRRLYCSRTATGLHAVKMVFPLSACYCVIGLGHYLTARFPLEYKSSGCK
jgi:hypothetical protein